MRRTKLLQWIVIAAIFTLPLNAAADRYTISDNVNLVLLDVSVRFPHGGFVPGLTKDNFRVFDDGHARTITHFDDIDAPVTVGLVVDDSGSMREKRPDVILAGLAFARESNPRDEFFVVNFNDYIAAGLPRPTLFTDNVQMLREALYYGKPMGQTALYDAIAYSLKHLELGHRDKRTLIVVSDGGDNVSQLKLRDLMKLIEASRATIYTVGLFTPYDNDRNPRVLKKLAKMSGGEYFQPEAVNEVVPLFKKISNEIRKRYTIGYIPDLNHDKHIIRTVKVEARDSHHKKLIVKTRTTYSIASLEELLAKQRESHHSIGERK